MLLWLSVFSMLFAYYASYLFATTAWDFRLIFTLQHYQDK